jgi:hypothetical protein
MSGADRGAGRGIRFRPISPSYRVCCISSLPCDNPVLARRHAIPPSRRSRP